MSTPTITDTTITPAAPIAQRPNYRIYDRTGGGVTHDIYAETLKDAIEAGREWIEDGDWSSEEDHGRTIKLECCVREIVYCPDLSSIEALPAVYNVEIVSEDRPHPLSPAGTILATVDAESLPSLEQCLAGTATLRVIDGSTVAEDGSSDAVCIVTLTSGRIPEVIDEDATLEGDSHDCSGSYSDPQPECKEADDDEHDWQSPHALVGGIRENPGYWSHGGTRTSCREVCTICGRYRTTTSAGSQRNSGEPLETVTYEDADEASEAWVRELRGDESDADPGL